MNISIYTYIDLYHKPNKSKRCLGLPGPLWTFFDILFVKTAPDAPTRTLHAVNQLKQNTKHQTTSSILSVVFQEPYFQTLDIQTN